MQDDDFEDDFYGPDEPVCERCHGDGRDPWTDYLMPCPLCEPEWLEGAIDRAKEPI